MNRRSFLGVLAALVPAALLPKPEPYEWTVVRSPWISVGPKYGKSITQMIDEEHARMSKAVDEMSALGDSMGSSFNFIKSRTASGIMAKADRR